MITMSWCTGHSWQILVIPCALFFSSGNKNTFSSVCGCLTFPALCACLHDENLRELDCKCTWKVQPILLQTTASLRGKHKIDRKKFSIRPVQEHTVWTSAAVSPYPASFFFFLIYFGLKFSPSSSGIHISLHLHPRIFIVHTSSSQIKEMIHTSPPACEPTTYLDSFLTKVNRIFMSRFRRAYMVQPVFDNHIPGKIISARRARSSKI